MERTPVRQTRRVLLLAFDDVTLVDIVGPADVFAITSRYALPAHEPGYDLSIASVAGGLIKASNGFRIETLPLCDVALPVDTLIIPGAGPPHAPPLPKDLIDWLSTSTRGIRRVCAVCTGTFLLAAAGLADGHRVTTHWEAADTLRSTFPSLSVEPNLLFLNDRRIWTSAGFSAGADLALALIREDLGNLVAMKVARSLVLFLVRPGLSPQISSSLRSQAETDEDFSRLHAWISDNLASDLRVERLARFVGMSDRTFARTYAAKCRQTPGKVVEKLRLDAACRLLLSTNMSLKSIAVEIGLSTELNLRRCFVKHFQITPSDFRRAYANEPVVSYMGAAETS